MAFVQIAEFDWLPGRQMGKFWKKNLLFRYHKVDEADTLHTYLWHYPLHKLCLLLWSGKNSGFYDNSFLLLWLYLAKIQVSFYRTICLSYIVIVCTKFA